MNVNDLKVFVDSELNSLDRMLVATPQTREDLESFSKANQGSNDFLLMQMSIQFGFKLAMENILELIEDKEK
jgi:hypothetical protein